MSPPLPSAGVSAQDNNNFASAEKKDKEKAENKKKKGTKPSPEKKVKQDASVVENKAHFAAAGRGVTKKNQRRLAGAKEAKKLIDSKRLDWEQANEAKINEMCGIKGDLLNASLFTCGRCKSTKTTSTQKQTRSADEPMTVFVLCLNCGKRWKC